MSDAADQPRPTLRTALAQGRGGGFRTAAPAADVLRLAADAGWRTARLDTSGIEDKAALMDRVARDLDLPAWFGRNWDALADALRDLDATPGTLLAWTGSEDLEESLRETLREVLLERAEEPAPTPAVLVVRASG